MRAAEQLFAQQGVDRVSLREIADRGRTTQRLGRDLSLWQQARADRNHLGTALATGPRQLGPSAGGRSQSIGSTCTPWSSCWSEPLVAKIDDPDGGRCFLELSAELVASRSFPDDGHARRLGPGHARDGQADCPARRRRCANDPRHPQHTLGRRAVRLDRRLLTADQQRRGDSARACSCQTS